MTATVVADCGTDGFGDFVQVADEFVDGLGSQLGSGFEGFVQIVDVGRMMFVMVDFHREGIDVGFEGVFRVTEFR
jgi:hypothetical protein